MRRGKTAPNGNEARKRSKKDGDSKSLNAYFKQNKSRTQGIKSRNPEGEYQEEQITEPGDENKGSPGKGFFACYLLTSLNPRHKGHTYIGFTVNPRRRIRQHNGEIGSGAYRTKKRRPWEMVVCIYGFPTNVSALQFEWAWQHPHESVAVRQAAATFKSLSGVANKIKLAYTMLTLPAWQSLNITVNFFSTKYKNHSAGCPSLPEQMKVKVCSMDELPCYTEPDAFECKDDFDNLDEYDEADDTGETLLEIYPSEAAIVSADNLHIPEASHEQFKHIEEYGTRKPGESSNLGICNVELVFIDSPIGKTTSIATGLPMVETVECADMGIAGKESMRGMQFTYDVEADEDPRTLVKEKLSTTNDQEYEKLGESSTFGVYHRQPFEDIWSPVQTSSSTGETAEGTDISIIETDCRIQRQVSALVAANEDQQPRTSEKPLTTTEVSVVKDQDPSSSVAHEVEVIDLLTPSPGYRVRPCTKKRRIAKFSTEIIDLT